MALSLSNFLYALCCTAFFTLSVAETVIYDFNITWVTTNPDAQFERTTIGINNQWPIPTIKVTKGDRVIVNVNNQLGNESTSLHFHGLFQNGTTHMDGPVGVSQCGIPPGHSFTYNFTVDQPGTYWYHSHERGQYPDGLRAPFVVYDPDSPYLGLYDEEIVLSLSDWYHDEMVSLIEEFISVENPTGAEPVPEAALMNDSQNVTFAFEAGKTYFFRIVNMGAFAGQYFWFEGHSMRIIEVDGVYTDPQEVDQIYVTVAQRYGVLVTAKNDTTSNFAFVGSMDEDLFDTVPATLNPNVTGWLVYDSKNELPAATHLDNFDPYDDFYLVPKDKEEVWEDPSQTLEMTMVMGNLGNGANYAFVNGVTYVRPKVPSLYTALTTGTYAINPVVYGPNTNSFILEQNQVIELILNNADTGKHPWHLHGHNFQVLYRSDEDAGYYATNSNATSDITIPQYPMRRDTFMVRPNGHFVLRFRSDNPGVWLFHCHIEWHVNSGLVATIFEAPLELQKTLSIPADHYDACIDSDTPYAGNAAANTKNLLDLTGANTSPAPLPAGFTARGIVALVFSCISAFLGMATIAWYGAAPLGTSEFDSAKKRVVQAGMAVSEGKVGGDTKSIGGIVKQ